MPQITISEQERRLARRDNLHELERRLGLMPQVELRVDHAFAEGIYTRTMYIPAGVALVGHIHKHPCLNIVPVGDIIVATETGVRRIVAPVMPFHSAAGTKRAGWAQRDTVWITVHANPTNERNVAVLEDFLIAQGYDNVLTSPHIRAIGAPHAQDHS